MKEGARVSFRILDTYRADDDKISLTLILHSPPMSIPPISMLIAEVVAAAAEVAVEVAMSMVVDVAMGIDMSDIPLISILAYVMSKLREDGVETKSNGTLMRIG